MEFDEVVTQVIDVLQRETGVSYRALKRRFGLDDVYFEEIKDELIYAKELAADEGGRVLVWVGGDRRAGDALPQVAQPGVGSIGDRPKPSPVEILAGDRRQLTVMFRAGIGGRHLRFCICARSREL
jgi:hypothetical protein